MDMQDKAAGGNVAGEQAAARDIVYTFGGTISAFARALGAFPWRMLRGDGDERDDHPHMLLSGMAQGVLNAMANLIICHPKYLGRLLRELPHDTQEAWITDLGRTVYEHEDISWLGGFATDLYALFDRLEHGGTLIRRSDGSFMVASPDDGEPRSQSERARHLENEIVRLRHQLAEVRRAADNGEGELPF